MKTLNRRSPLRSKDRSRLRGSTRNEAAYHAQFTRHPKHRGSPTEHRTQAIHITLEQSRSILIHLARSSSWSPPPLIADYYSRKLEVVLTPASVWLMWMESSIYGWPELQWPSTTREDGTRLHEPSHRFRESLRRAALHEFTYLSRMVTTAPRTNRLEGNRGKSSSPSWQPLQRMLLTQLTHVFGGSGFPPVCSAAGVYEESSLTGLRAQLKKRVARRLK